MFRWESEYIATHCPFSSARGPGRMNGVLAGNSWPRPPRGVDRFESLLYNYSHMRSRHPVASRHSLETRRQQLLSRLALPPDGLPGSLALSHRRCGSPTCHCRTDPQGHPSWTLTFMADGGKRVVHVPTETVEDVRARVESGSAFKSRIAELLAINAQLMVLDRQARTRAARPTRRAQR